MSFCSTCTVHALYIHCIGQLHMKFILMFNKGKLLVYNFIKETKFSNINFLGFEVSLHTSTPEAYAYNLGLCCRVDYAKKLLPSRCRFL